MRRIDTYTDLPVIAGNSIVMITKEEYDDLKNDSIVLAALRAAGVDNWEGYEIALEELE